MTESSTRHHLEQMKKAGIIRREDADKGGKWIIVKNN
jgi:predicted HTH transcriptional regulator